MLCCAVLCCAVLCCAVLCCAVLCCAALRCARLAGCARATLCPAASGGPLQPTCFVNGCLAGVLFTLVSSLIARTHPARVHAAAAKGGGTAEPEVYLAVGLDSGGTTHVGGPGLKHPGPGCEPLSTAIVCAAQALRDQRLGMQAVIATLPAPLRRTSKPAGIKESEFRRKRLQLVVVLDVSGSMGEPGAGPAPSWLWCLTSAAAWVSQALGRHPVSTPKSKGNLLVVCAVHTSVLRARFDTAALPVLPLCRLAIRSILLRRPRAAEELDCRR